MAKVLISLPDDLLERIDHEVRSRGGSRSGYVAEAARRQLGWPAADDIMAALERGRAALSEAGRFESAQLIREERLAHDAKHRRP